MPTRDDTQVLPADVRARFDIYLDAVEQALARAGKARDARRAITDDLDAQLQEMLGDRPTGQAPTIADAESVIASLDSPEAYASESGESRAPRPVAALMRPAYEEQRTLLAKRIKIMRTAMLVTLIICGTIVLLTPALVDHLEQRLVVAALTARPDATHVDFGGHMQDAARMFLHAVGVLMILVGIGSGLLWRPRIQA